MAVQADSSNRRVLEIADRVNVTIDRIDGGYSSAAERLTVAQDVVGSIPTSRPNSQVFYIQLDIV